MTDTPAGLPSGYCARRGFLGLLLSLAAPWARLLFSCARGRPARLLARLVGTAVDSGEPGWPLAWSCGPGVALPAPASLLKAARPTAPARNRAGRNMTAMPLPGAGRRSRVRAGRVTEVTSATLRLLRGRPGREARLVRPSPASPVQRAQDDDDRHRVNYSGGRRPRHADSGPSRLTVPGLAAGVGAPGQRQRVRYNRRKEGTPPGPGSRPYPGALPGPGSRRGQAPRQAGLARPRVEAASAWVTELQCRGGRRSRQTPRGRAAAGSLVTARPPMNHWVPGNRRSPGHHQARGSRRSPRYCWPVPAGVPGTAGRGVAAATARATALRGPMTSSRVAPRPGVTPGSGPGQALRGLNCPPYPASPGYPAAPGSGPGASLLLAGAPEGGGSTLLRPWVAARGSAAAWRAACPCALTPLVKKP